MSDYIDDRYVLEVKLYCNVSLCPELCAFLTDGCLLLMG